MGSIYRSRVKGKYSDETRSFVSSLIDDSRILDDDLNCTEAHDIMLHEQGLLSREELTKILKSLEKLRREWVEGKLKLEGEYEDVHELVEAYVILDVGPEVGGKLHSGRSRNDQVATDIRMHLRFDLLTISQTILRLVRICLSRAEEEKATPMLLYTHTQQAQVGTFGHYLLSFTDILLRDYQRLQECYDRVNASPLGAGPVGGTSIPIDRNRTAFLLGFDSLVKNSLDASSSRDFIIEAVASLAILMTNICRIANDIILWNSSEFGLVELADEFASVSSIMPHKKNPTTLELIRGKTSRVEGDLIALLGISKGLPSGYSSDLQEMKPILWNCLDTTLTSLRILTVILESLIIRKDRMEKMAQESYVFALDLAEHLTVEGLLSFRQAHTLVGTLVREMVNRRIEPNSLTPKIVEALAKKVLGRQIKIPSSVIEDVTDPRRCLANRSSLGSPNPKHVEQLLQESRKIVLTAEEALATRLEKLETSRAKLSELVNQYTEFTE